MNKMDADKEDKELWRSFTLGNEQALSCVYCKYFNYLYNYGLKISGDEDFVKDCIQELFLHLWENKGKLGAVQYVKAYLLQALRKNVLTKLSRGKRRALIRKDLALSEPAITFSAEDLLIQEEKGWQKSTQVAAALNDLTARQREAVYLRCYKDLSYEEIAVVMSINYQSVVNHIHEAFKALKNNEALKTVIKLSIVITGSACSVF